MTFSNLESIFYILAFLVPGFLCNSVLVAMVPRGVDAKEFTLLRFFGLSCFNYAFWSWLVYLIVKLDFFTQHPIRSSLAWVFIILISPLALGMFFGSMSQRETARKMLQRLGIYTIHPVPTAWDYFFSKTPPTWLLAILKDGRAVAGYFGERSFASSQPGERDIYRQEVYRVDESGPWTRVDHSAGV